MAIVPRYAMLIPALLGLVAYQRPDWVGGAADGLRDVGARFGIALPLGRSGSIADRAGAAEPDRAAALAALDRAAEGRTVEAASQGDATARDRVRELLRSAAATMAGSEAMGELRA